MRPVFGILFVVLTALLDPFASCAQENQCIIAVVNGREIRFSEVDRRAGLRLQELRTEIFQLRETALSDVIDDTLLEQQAIAEGTSSAEFRRRLTDQVYVTEPDVEEEIRKLFSPDADRNARLRKKVRLRLERNRKREVVAGKARELRKQARIELLLSRQPQPESNTNSEISCGDNPDQVVARINGEEVTLGDVDRALGARLLAAEMKVFQGRKTILDRLIRKVLFENEARAQGLSLEDYTKAITASAEAEVSESGIQDMLKQMYPPDISEDADYRRQVRTALVRDKTAALFKASEERLRRSAKVEIHLPLPTLPPVEVQLGNRPGRGHPDAPVTIVEFGDFQCDRCQAAAAVIKELLARHGNRVRVFYRHFPLPNHPQAWLAAEASECARAEGKFWEFHDFLFERENSLSFGDLGEAAVNIGIPRSSFQECLVTGRYRSVVKEDLREAYRLAVTGTPTFFVNGRRFSGMPSADDFSQLIEHELGNVSQETRREEDQTK